MSNAWTARSFLDAHPHAIRIRIVETNGSSPREPGTWMLVAPGAAYRTIGGGQLEYMAIDRARAMLRKGSSQDRLDVPLGPEIGQCCGGRVLLRLERIDARIAAQCIAEEVHAHASAPIVHVFGAGHVGRALAAALLLLPVRLVVADSRREEIDRVPAGAERRLTSLPEELIREAPSGSAFVILTHDHALDFILAAEALARDDAAYAGMIGSRTKMKTFRSWYLRNGGDRDRFDRLAMPIGGSTKDKRPEVIAAFVAAEIMQALLDYTPSSSNSGAGPVSERVS